MNFAITGNGISFEVEIERDGERNFVFVKMDGGSWLYQINHDGWLSLAGPRVAFPEVIKRAYAKLAEVGR